MIDGAQIHIGTFDTAADAAFIRDIVLLHAVDAELFPGFRPSGWIAADGLTLSEEEVGAAIVAGVRRVADNIGTGPVHTYE